MTTLTEDDVLEQLDAQNNLLSFMTTAHNILLQGIKRFLPSLFVNNDEEIVEYAVKPLLARSGPLDDIDVALRLIYALDELVGGNKILFSATGVTGGDLVKGIQQVANGVRTQTLLIGGADRTCNIIDSLHSW